MKKSSEKVFIYIKDKISNEDWKEGERITPEIALSKELEVSRASVREAIEKMVALGILEKIKGKGSYVKKIGCGLNFNEFLRDSITVKSDFLEILEFRKGFESRNVEIFIENATEEEIKKLEDIYYKMIQNKKYGEKFANLDAIFHKIIAEGTKNSIIIKISEILANMMVEHQKKLNNILGHEKGIKEHALILEAIKNRDTELGVLYSRRHIDRTEEDVRQLFEEKI